VAGAGDVPLFDQRGAPYNRIVNGRIDIGAVELPPPGPALPGDYNLNGAVDAADYVYWRKVFGATVAAYAAADGNGDTAINDSDYSVWSQNFGETLGPGSGEALQTDSGGNGFPTALSAEYSQSPEDRLGRSTTAMMEPHFAPSAISFDAALLAALDSIFPRGDKDFFEAELPTTQEGQAIDDSDLIAGLFNELDD
jgi:hypothetical protein